MGSERKRGRKERRGEKGRATVAGAATTLTERDVAANKENLSALLDEQKAVLERAAAIVRDAGLQLGTFTRDEVTPKVRDTMHNVKPFLAGGVAATALASNTAKQKIKAEVLPAVAEAVEKAQRLGKKLSAESSARVELLAKKAGLVETKPVAPSAGPGRYILIGLGAVAVAGLAYAVWQTLRADDDLWIEDEPEAIDDDLSIEPESNAPAASI
jgi:hypothetical protein